LIVACVFSEFHENSSTAVLLTDRQTDRQTDRHMDKLTETNTLPAGRGNYVNCLIVR